MSLLIAHLACSSRGERAQLRAHHTSDEISEREVADARGETNQGSGETSRLLPLAHSSHLAGPACVHTASFASRPL